MARVFTDGAEMGDILFWTYMSGVVSSGPPAPYDGTYFYSVGNYQSGYKYFSPLSEFYFRARMYGNSGYYPSFRYDTAGLLFFTWDMYYRYCVTLAGGTVAGTHAININAWHLFEYYIKIADSPNGICQVYIDGTLEIDYTGDTKNGSYSTANNVYYWGTSAGTVYIDDIALNDTTGGVDDSWCGDGSIVIVTPDDNGTDNDWTGSDGNQVDNFEMVDDIPKDNDTTYVAGNVSSSGLQDQYGMSDYDGTDKTITRIYPEARARLSGASAVKLKLGILASGGADETDAGTTLGVGSYTRVVGDEYTENPVDTNPWEEADIDAIEGIIEVE